MDYGADDPLGIEQQIYLQDLIKNNPGAARMIASFQGSYDGLGLTPHDAAQNRYSSNMRQAFPVEYFAPRALGNVLGNPQGAGQTLSDILRRMK